MTIEDEIIGAISTKDHAGKYDGFASLKPGEPFFALQGGDPLVPPLVMQWAALARFDALRMPEGDKRTDMLKRASNAENVAWLMMSYQRGELPVEGERATYIESTPEEKTARQKAIEAANAIRNALALSKDASDAIEKAKGDPQMVLQICLAIDELYSLSNIIDPRKGMERS